MPCRAQVTESSSQNHTGDSDGRVVHRRAGDWIDRRKDEESRYETYPEDSHDIDQRGVLAEMEWSTNEGIGIEQFTHDRNHVGDVQADGGQTGDGHVRCRIDQIGKGEQKCDGARQPDCIQWARETRMDDVPPPRTRLKVKKCHRR